MIHIEKTTGKSYPITDMTDEHIKKVIEYYLELLEKIGFNENIRYTIEFEKQLLRFVQYMFVAIGRGIWNPPHEHKLIEIYKKYAEHKSRESIIEMPQVWESNLIS